MNLVVRINLKIKIMYFWIGLFIFIIITVICAVFFSFIMNYLKENKIFYKKYTYNSSKDYRYLIFIIVGMISFILWPILIIGTVLGYIYYSGKNSSKVKRIIDILNE